MGLGELHSFYHAKYTNLLPPNNQRIAKAAKLKYFSQLYVTYRARSRGLEQILEPEKRSGQGLPVFAISAEGHFEEHGYPRIEGFRSGRRHWSR